MQKLFVGLLLAIVALLALSGGPTRDRTGDDSGLQLELPSFVALAAEAQAQEKGVNFLQQEAGISAYVKINQTIDLTQVKGTFKTVETVSDEYIIGEVALPNLPEEAHPHIYVNKEGWIVAYYSKDEPTSKIMNWGKAIVGTTLQEAVRQVLSPVKTEEIKYYNFKYPNANRIMMITETIEKGNQGDSINMTIPQGLRLFEASWSLYSPSDYSSWLQIDSTQIGSLGARGVLYGDLTSRLRVDFRHAIQIRAQYENYEKSFVIVLIYQV